MTFSFKNRAFSQISFSRCEQFCLGSVHAEVNRVEVKEKKGNLDYVHVPPLCNHRWTDAPRRKEQKMRRQKKKEGRKKWNIRTKEREIERYSPTMHAFFFSSSKIGVWRSTNVSTDDQRFLSPLSSLGWSTIDRVFTTDEIAAHRVAMVFHSRVHALPTVSVPRAI